MMVLPQELMNMNNSDSSGMMVIGLPRDLHKKRFHREKKLRMRMRRCRSMPMVDKKVVSSSTSSSTSSGDAPLSPDRWGNSANNNSKKRTTNALPQLPVHSSSGASERPGFHEGTTQQTKDSQFQLPKRQRSFQDDDPCHSIPSTRQTIPRSKSNVETVMVMIDRVMEHLKENGEEELRD